MPDPSWDIEFSESIDKVRLQYSQKLNQRALAASVRRKPSSRTPENAFDEQDAFTAFLSDLSAHGAKHRDPRHLPPAYDKDGVVIPNHYIFEDDPWTAYLWRNEARGVAIVVLLFEEADRKKMLARFSPATS